MQTEHTFSVSELNSQARQLLERHYSDIKVNGEISQVSRPPSGHVYFTLKDSESEIRCAFFARHARRYDSGNETVERGNEVDVSGSISIYLARGDYQLLVRRVEHAGTGDLWRKFQALKKTFEQRGYFDQERKKRIPQLPKTVGLVTARSGAVVHDMIKAFSRRNPTAELVLYPVAVQGDRAAGEIADAIRLANLRKDVDVLIVARGGGSIEDLWAFNESPVVEAICESDIPVVSGIGHQTDRSLADLVADKEAATPTAAAELLSTPTIADLDRMFHQQQRSLLSAVENRLNGLGQKVDLAERGLVHPRQKLLSLNTGFDHAVQKLHALIRSRLLQDADRARSVKQNLNMHSPIVAVNAHRQSIRHVGNVMKLRMDGQISEMNARLQSLEKQIEAVNPEATLKRGYAIVRDPDDGAVVRDVKNVSIGQKVSAQLVSGTLHCEVEQIDS